MNGCDLVVECSLGCRFICVCRLVDHGLRHNFLLHLLNLWDNSLLNSRAIIDCMLIVDHIAVRPTDWPRLQVFDYQQR